MNACFMATFSIFCVVSSRVATPKTTENLLQVLSPLDNNGRKPRGSTIPQIQMDGIFSINMS